jgi:hypothetical protein
MKLTALAVVLACGPGCPDPSGSIPGFFDKPFMGDLVEIVAQSLEEMAELGVQLPLLSLGDGQAQMLRLYRPEVLSRSMGCDH